jgi:glycosyltransferase involved in cell wall biosynthesis
MREAERKTKVLIFCEYFLPGFRAGGPIVTLRNVIETLGEDITFLLVTGDRDLGDMRPYPGLETETWMTAGKAKVFYVPERKLGLVQAVQLIREQRPDIIYVNSFLSRRYSLVPQIARRLARASGASVILAPRGEFSAGALRLKRRRKRLYIALLKASGLLRDVLWQASSEYEAQDIRCAIDAQACIHIAPDLVSLAPSFARPKPKRTGEAQIVFLGRISPMKNLDGAFRLLVGLRGRVTFAIHGPVEDATYWASCQEAAQDLPANVVVDHRGLVTPANVPEVLAAADVLLLPSLGENFAHVVLEALAAGCPVVLSDRTPWRGLADKGIGWDLPLDEESAFTAALQSIVDMDEPAHAAMRARARAFAESVVEDPVPLARNKDLFAAALASRHP